MFSGTLRSLKTPRALVILAGSTLAVASPALRTAVASPEGAQVVAGSASVSRVGDLTRITASNNAILNFRSLNILPHETVQFVQPSVSARVLGRITGGAPTLIQGSLLANGQVYLINQAGITFAAGSVVNVGAIYAGAARLSDASFLGGEDRFTNASGAVRNYGVITGEFVSLLGKEVASAGSIIADRGNVVLAAGNDIFITRQGSSVMVKLDATPPTDQVRPSAAGDAGPAAPRVSNTGTIEAPGGGVRMLAGDAFGIAVVQSGRVRAQRVEIEGTGRGDVRVSGKIDASNSAVAGLGGAVAVTGQRVVIDDATIDASGGAGGGSIRIGGDYQGGGTLRRAERTFVTPGSSITADAVSTGSGGLVVVWSDQLTAMGGTLSARGGVLGGDGGVIETSSRGYLEVAGAKISAAGRGGGKAGLLLLDPADIEISGSGLTGSGAFTGGTFDPDNVGPAATSTIRDSDINTLLAANTSVTITNVGSTGTGPNGGRIRVDSTASLANANFGSAGNAASLTLTSAGSIVVNGAVASSVPLTLTAVDAITVTSGSFAPRSLSATSTAGSIVVSQGLTTVGSQSFSVPGGQSVTLGGTYTTTNSSFSVLGGLVITANTSVNVGSGNVDFTGNVTTASAGRALTITSSGVTSFSGNIGTAGTRLGLVAVNPISAVGSTNFNGTSVFASGVGFNQLTTFGGSGSVTIDVSSPAQTLTINSLVLALPAATSVTLNSAGDMSLSNGVVASVTDRTTLTINASGRSVVIGGTGMGTTTQRLAGVSITAASLDISGAAVLTTGAQSYTVTSDFAVDSLDAATGGVGIAGGSTAAVSVAGPIVSGGGVTTAGATVSLGSVTSSGSQSYTGATSTTLQGTYLTGNGDFTVTGPALLGANSTVTAGTGDVSFTGSVLSGGTARALTVTGNDISFGGAIGSATVGQGLTTLSVTGTANGGDTASVALATANASGAIVLAGTDVSASGGIAGGATVSASGATLSLRGVSSGGAQGFTGSTSTTLSGAYSTGNGSFLVTGPTVLAGTTTVNAGTGNVTLSGDVTGSAANRALTVNSGGLTTFGGNLGTAGTRLGQVQVNQVGAAGTTTFQGTSIFASTLGFNQDTTFRNAVAPSVSVNTTSTLTINQLTLDVSASTSVQLTSSSTVSLSNGVTTATSGTGDLAITATNQQVLVGGSGIGSSGNRLRSVTISAGSIDLTGAAAFTTENQSFATTSDFAAERLDASVGSVTVSGGGTSTVEVTDAITAGTTVTTAGRTVSLVNVASTGAQSHTGAISVTLGGTYSTGNGGFAVTGPAILGANTTITAGTGDVSFASTVQSGGTARNLTITGNDVTFAGAVGSATPGLAVATLGVTGTANGGDAASIALTSAITSGAITLAGTDVSATGAITSGGAVTVTASSVSVRSVTSTGAQSYTASGGTTLSGTYLTNNGGFAVTGPAVLAGNSTVTAGTGDVSFSSTVLSNGTARSLVVTGNDISFGGDIGSSTAGEQVSALSITGTASGADAASVALTSATSAGAISLTGGAVTATGALLAGGSVTTSGTSVVLADVTSSGVQSHTGPGGVTLAGTYLTGGNAFTVSGPAILAGNTTITAGAGDVGFGATVLSNGTARSLSVTGNDITFGGTLGSSVAGEKLSTLSVVGSASGGDAASITLAGANTTASISLSGETITATGAVTAGGTATTSGTTVSLRDVTSSGAQSHTGTSGTTLNGTYTTGGGSFSVTGPALLGGNTTVAAGAGDVDFTGTVTSTGQSRGLTVGGGNVTFGGAVGGGVAANRLSSLTVTGSAAVELAGVTTIGSQSYTAPTVRFDGAGGYSVSGLGSIVVDSANARFAGSTQSMQTAAGSIRFISAQPMTVENGTAATITVAGGGSFLLLRGGVQLGATGSLTLDGRGVNATAGNVPIRIGGAGGAAGGNALAGTGASVFLRGIADPTATLGTSTVFGAFDAAGAPSATSSPLAVTLGSGSFDAAPSSRVVSLGGLSITAATTTLSYVAVLGDLNVTSASITLAGVSSGRTSQADGTSVDYRGAQIVGGNVTLSSVPTVGGSGGARIGATTSVANAPADTSVLLAPDQVGAANFLVAGNVFAPAAVSTLARNADVITTAIAGAVPPSTRFLVDDGLDFVVNLSRRTSAEKGVTINLGGK